MIMYTRITLASCRTSCLLILKCCDTKGCLEPHPIILVRRVRPEYHSFQISKRISNAMRSISSFQARTLMMMPCDVFCRSFCSARCPKQGGPASPDRSPNLTRNDALDSPLVSSPSPSPTENTVFIRVSVRMLWSFRGEEHALQPEDDLQAHLRDAPPDAAKFTRLRVVTSDAWDSELSQKPHLGYLRTYRGAHSHSIKRATDWTLSFFPSLCFSLAGKSIPSQRPSQDTM